MNLSNKCIALWICIFCVMNNLDSAPVEVDEDLRFFCLIKYHTLKARECIAPVEGDEQSEKINLTFPNCGKRSQKKEKRDSLSDSPRANRVERWNQAIKPVIVGGQESKQHSWPWMAAIFGTYSDGEKYFQCGGTLISRRYVLTAAHCIKLKAFESPLNIDSSRYVVFLGSHFQNDGTEYKVSSVILYPKYKFNNFDYHHDIALLKLEKEVELTANVNPICLPSKGGLGAKFQEEGEFTVTGWGDTNENKTGTNGLREVNVQLHPLEACNKKYQGSDHNITENEICAHGEGKDACQGDSGGPLVSKLKDDENTYALVGIVSFGIGCAKPEYPGVYARVSRYIRWLYENTDLGK